MTTLIKLTPILPPIMTDPNPLNASCACEPSPLYIAALSLLSALEFVDDAVASAASALLATLRLAAVLASLSWKFGRVIYAYAPSATDITLLLALYHTYILFRVRPLDPYSRKANALLYATRHTVVLNIALALSRLLRWPSAALLVAYRSSASGLPALPAKLVRAAVASAPGSSAYLSLPPAFYTLAVDAFTVVITTSLMLHYPVDGIPIDTALWSEAPKPQPQCHVENGHMGMTVVLRLRAQGIEPEVWRRGPHPAWFDERRQQELDAQYAEILAMRGRDWDRRFTIASGCVNAGSKYL